MYSQAASEHDFSEEVEMGTRAGARRPPTARYGSESRLSSIKVVLGVLVLSVVINVGCFILLSSGSSRSEAHLQTLSQRNGLLTDIIRAQVDATASSEQAFNRLSKQVQILQSTRVLAAAPAATSGKTDGAAPAASTPAAAPAQPAYKLLSEQFTLPPADWGKQDKSINIVKVNLDSTTQVKFGGKPSMMINLPPEPWLHGEITNAIQGRHNDYIAELSRQLTSTFQIPENSVFLDIGCNMGVVSLPYAVGRKNEVICVEPIPSNCRSLARSVLLNDISDRYHIICGAAGVTDGTIQIHYPEGRTDNAALNPAAATQNIKNRAIGVDVKIYKLDSVLEDFPRLDKLELIKIDVQGFEFNVIQGIKNILQKYSPVVEIENDHGLTRSAGFDPNQVYNFMSDLGYSSYCGLAEVPKASWPPRCADITWRKGPARW